MRERIGHDGDGIIARIVLIRDEGGHFPRLLLVSRGLQVTIDDLEEQVNSWRVARPRRISPVLSSIFCYNRQFAENENAFQLKINVPW